MWRVRVCLPGNNSWVYFCMKSLKTWCSTFRSGMLQDTSMLVRSLVKGEVSCPGLKWCRFGWMATVPWSSILLWCFLLSQCWTMWERQVAAHVVEQSSLCWHYRSRFWVLQTQQREQQDLYLLASWMLRFDKQLKLWEIARNMIFIMTKWWNGSLLSHPKEERRKPFVCKELWLSTSSKNKK